jgi:hypothetical protein
MFIVPQAWDGLRLHALLTSFGFGGIHSTRRTSTLHKFGHVGQAAMLYVARRMTSFLVATGVLFQLCQHTHTARYSQMTSTCCSITSSRGFEWHFTALSWDFLSRIRDHRGFQDWQPTVAIEADATRADHSVRTGQILLYKEHEI